MLENLSRRAGRRRVAAASAFAVAALLPLAGSVTGGPQSLAQTPPPTGSTTTTQPGPTLLLSPTSGRAGSVVTATGDNHSNVCRRVQFQEGRDVAVVGSGEVVIQLLWDGGEVVAEFVLDTEPFKVDFVVPDTPPGTHQVESWCSARGTAEKAASAEFLVIAPPPQGLLLDVDPARGLVGSNAVAQGTGHTCDRDLGTGTRQSVELMWDGSISLGRVTPSESGTFSRGFRIPSTPVGIHQVTSRCRIGSGLRTATSNFDVIAQPQPPLVTTTTTNGTATTTTTPTTATVTTTPPSTTGPGVTNTTPGSAVGPLPTSTTTTQTTSTTVPTQPGDLRSVFPTSLLRPSEVPLDLSTIARHVFLAILLVLLIAFPAELFNKTVEENSDRIRSWFRRLPKPALPSGSRASIAAFAVFAVASAILYGLLDPEYGLNDKGLVLSVGLLVAIVVTTLAFEFPIAYYARKVCRQPAFFRAYPIALLIGVVCVAASRLADFQPGYAYGIIGGYALIRGRELSRDDDGRSVVMAATALFSIAIVSWFAWIPFDRAADRNPNDFGVAFGDEIFSTTFVMGLEGLVFGLVPLTFMDGAKLARWRRSMWLLAYGLVIFAFVHLVLDPRAEYVELSESASLGGVLVLFFAFAAASIAFWAYFRNLNRADGPLHAAE